MQPHERVTRVARRGQPAGRFLLALVERVLAEGAHPECWIDATISRSGVPVSPAPRRRASRSTPDRRRGVQQQRVGAGALGAKAHPTAAQGGALRWRRRRSRAEARTRRKPVAKASHANDGAGKERVFMRASGGATADARQGSRIAAREWSRSSRRLSTPRPRRDPGARGQSRRQRVAPDRPGGHVAEIDPADLGEVGAE